MKMKWRIALGTAGAVALAAAVIAAVPTTRAAAGEFFAHVFRIDIDDAMQFEYLPDGFEPKPVYLAGSVSDAAQGEAVQQAQQALYQNGDLFLLVKTATDASQALPAGEAAEVNGLPAVLRIGLSGTFDGPAVVPPAGSGAAASGVTASDAAVEFGVDVQSDTGDSAGLTNIQGSGSSVQGSGLDLPSIAYDNANSLTWDMDGTRVEILTNLPVEELLKIAEGLALGD